jgi:hypothetical protein
LALTASTFYPVVFVVVAAAAAAAATDDDDDDHHHHHHHHDRDNKYEIGGFDGFEYEHNALMRHDLLQFFAQIVTIRTSLLQSKRDTDTSKMVTQIFSKK